MSWSRRSVLALPVLASVAACGFTPAFAPGGPGGALQGRVVADAPSDRLGFRFVARMEDRLGRSSTPDYALGYRISIDRTAVGVSPENATTRYVVRGVLVWTLRPAAGGDPVAGGTIENSTAYSATGTTVATEAARTDAEDRLMVILADQLVTALLIDPPGSGP